MIWKRLILLLGLGLLGCGHAKPPPAQHKDWIAPLAIDDVTLFVPTKWNRLLPWEPRPWPNGLRIDSGGWGQFEPWLGPLQSAGEYWRPPPGKPFRADITARPPQPNYPDPFFRLVVTFEYPAPSPWKKTWWGGRRWQPVFPYEFDQLTYNYLAPAEPIDAPYVDLLAGLRPSDGEDVGSGWREVHRVFEKKDIALRFDATDWREHGGALPQRLAASFGEPIWSHFMPLDQPRWGAAFETQSLPVDQWRSRYQTAEQLFDWLQTAPEKRNPAQRFVWWTDLRFRPDK
jgi:hypothetical protein